MAKVFRSTEHKDEVYRLIAEALRRLHGGRVMAVEGRCFSGWAAFRVPEYNGPLVAQHAVLALSDGTFMDASGRCTQRIMLARTARSAKYVASALSIRELRVTA